MNSKKFNYLQKRAAIPCPAGETIKEVFTLKTEGNNMKLVRIGTEKINEKIQSYHDQVSLSTLIKRYQRGDDSALNRGAGFYADVTGMPDNMVDTIALNVRARAVLMDIAQKKNDKSDDKVDDKPVDQADDNPVDQASESEVVENG